MAKHAPSLPDEVIFANLGTYTDAALDGRVAHFEREALFERDKTTRIACRAEAERTKDEIDRRRLERAAGAAALFA